MTLDQIASVSSIAASVAVIVSLVFIGLQLRPNAHLTRMAAAQISAQLRESRHTQLVGLNTPRLFGQFRRLCRWHLRRLRGRHKPDSNRTLTVPSA